MSTRSHSDIWNEDGSLDVIYCHWDGYPSYNGAVLLHHYQDPEKIRELIALGDINQYFAKGGPDEVYLRTLYYYSEDACLHPISDEN